MSKKSRKLIRQGTPLQESDETASAKPDADDREDLYAEFAGRDWGFHFLPDSEPQTVDEKALHGLMKDWRHGRASRTLGQVLGDAYFALFSLALIGAMIVNLLINAQKNMSGCTEASCLSGRTLFPWALLFSVGTLTLSVARIFGPVLASAAEGSWLMEAPISRTRLLGGRLWAIVGGAFGVGVAAGAVLTAASGTAPVLVVGWGLALGCSASALMAIAAFEQSSERVVLVRVLQSVFGLAAAAVVAAMVLVSAGVTKLALPGWVVEAPWAVAALGGLLTVLFATLAFRRLNLIRRARLISGGSLVSGMQGAMFALDLGLARDILVERDAVARGFVKPTRGRGLGVQALGWRDVQRLMRFPKPLIGLLASALVPYAADALGLSFLMPFLAALALVTALIPFLGSMRVLSRTGGLARAFPFSTVQIRNATMVVPAVLALLWAVLVYPAVVGLAGGGIVRTAADALVISLAIAAAGLLGAVRWQTAKQVDFATPMVATNAGAMPPTLIFNLFRGLDVCAVVTAPIMLGAAPYWALGVVGVVYLLLRGGMNMEALQEEAAEQKRVLAEQKAGPSGDKIKISRPAGPQR